MVLEDVPCLPSISSAFNVFIVESDNKLNFEAPSEPNKVPSICSKFNKKQCSYVSGRTKCDFDWQSIKTVDEVKLEDLHIMHHYSQTNGIPFSIRPLLYNYECYGAAKRLKSSIRSKIHSDIIFLSDPAFTKKMMKMYDARLEAEKDHQKAIRIIKRAKLDNQLKLPTHFIENTASRPMFFRAQNSLEKKRIKETKPDNFSKPKPQSLSHQRTREKSKGSKVLRLKIGDDYYVTERNKKEKCKQGIDSNSKTTMLSKIDPFADMKKVKQNFRILPYSNVIGEDFSEEEMNYMCNEFNEKIYELKRIQPTENS